MYADVRLEATRLSGRVVVPARAIIERDNRPSYSWCVMAARNGPISCRDAPMDWRPKCCPTARQGQIPLNVGDVVLVEGTSP
jgi:hypothetical protein